MPIDIGTAGVKALPRWSLLDAADRKASWRPGGLQHLALHTVTHRLYSLMHVGGAGTHKEAGTEVWVYDLAAKRRVQRIALADPATAITVTRDAKPVLFAIFIGAPKLDVYDPAAGKRLRSIAEIGFTPVWLVTY